LIITGESIFGGSLGIGIGVSGIEVIPVIIVGLSWQCSRQNIESKIILCEANL
jgi:hypothetical protein